MENKDRLYIVSFGDSNKFRVPFSDSAEALVKSRRLVDLEKQLNEYVNSKLPLANATLFTNPTVIEVDRDDPRFKDYPLLDDASVEKLKERMLAEVEDMEDQRSLDSNAPWNDVKA